MTVIVQDSFNRANSTSLGTADTGQVWQSLNGSIGISSNQAYAAAPNTDQDTQMYVESGASNVKISLTFVTLGTNEEEIYFRLVDANNYLRTARYQGDLYLQKCVAGAITTVTTVPRYNAGDTVMISANGSAVIVSYNGVQKISTTITNFTTATKHGFGFWSSPTARVDNFIIEDFNTGGTPTTQDGTASIVGTGTLSSTGLILKNSSASLVGTGTLSATATKIQNALAAILGTGTLTASPVIIKNGQTSMIGQGLLVANADTLASVIVIDGSADLKGSGYLTANSITLKNGSATLQGQGILTANADTIHTPTTINGVFTALGTGFLTVEGEIIEFIEPEAPAITVDVILELLFDTENKTSLVSEVQTLVQAQFNLENKVSLTFNL